MRRTGTRLADGRELIYFDADETGGFINIEPERAAAMLRDVPPQ